MPIIVDVHAAADAFKHKAAEYSPILDRLLSGKVKIVHGGKLTEEYSRISEVRRIITVLDQAGRAIKLPDKLVNDEASLLAKNKACASNDEHIIAIARIANASLLCSNDQLLHTDFTNKSLVNKPRGKVYQNHNHIHLLNRINC